MFIRVDFKNALYESLEKELFETEYGVTGLARDRQNACQSTYVKCNYIRVCGCVLSPVLLLCGAFSENGLLTMFSLCITVMFFYCCRC